MQVIDVNWGAWFKLQKNDRIFYSILCQIGRGTNELVLEWDESIQIEARSKNLSCDQLLEHILNHFYEYNNKMVSESLKIEASDAIYEFNELHRNKNV